MHTACIRPFRFFCHLAVYNECTHLWVGTWLDCPTFGFWPVSFSTYRQPWTCDCSPTTEITSDAPPPCKTPDQSKCLPPGVGVPPIWCNFYIYVFFLKNSAPICSPRGGAMMSPSEARGDSVEDTLICPPARPYIYKDDNWEWRYIQLWSSTTKKVSL